MNVDEAAGWAGAYIHIPFCAAVCPYCDFAVVAGRDDQIERYLSALERDVALDAAWRPLDAVFVGGGTPTHITPKQLGRVIDALEARHGIAAGAEVTLEANPEDWSPQYAEALLDVGFKRVSFGVQSFDADVLAFLGRRHTPADAGAAVEAAQAAGFGSVSVDLMFGSPGESLASWQGSVSRAIELGVDHVSTYSLTVEKGTALFRAVEAGAPAPDPDDQADKYEHAVEALGTAGYEHYEVSNHAKPGHACRYNLTAWAQGEYVAYGMSAHSHRNGERAWRARRLDTYLERLETGESPVQGRERLDGDARERERLMIGLRRTAGAVAGPTGEAWVASAEGERFVEAEVVELEGGRLRIVRPLLADAVVRSVLAAAPTVQDPS